MENYEKHYREIEKLTDNPFLNLYHIDALGRDGTPFHYYFASRNDEDNIKHKTHSMSPEGMAVYAVTEDNIWYWCGSTVTPWTITSMNCQQD